MIIKINGTAMFYFVALVVVFLAFSAMSRRDKERHEAELLRLQNPSLAIQPTTRNHK